MVEGYFNKVFKVFVKHQLVSNDTEVKLASNNKYVSGKCIHGVVSAGINVEKGRREDCVDPEFRYRPRGGIP